MSRGRTKVCSDMGLTMNRVGEVWGGSGAADWVCSGCGDGGEIVSDGSVVHLGSGAVGGYAGLDKWSSAGDPCLELMGGMAKAFLKGDTEDITICVTEVVGLGVQGSHLVHSEGPLVITLMVVNFVAALEPGVVKVLPDQH